MSKKEKAAYLVKWIHQNVIYDHAAASPYTVSDSVLSSYGYKSRNDSKMWEASTSYGALVKRQAICGGISSAYFLAAKAVGLKCITITGTLNSKPHAWNMVCVGSYWYYVDATNIATLRVSLGRNYGFDRKTIEKEHPLLPFTE
jgi:transglutaminase/protease-like cytokinesis protein 3